MEKFTSEVLPKTKTKVLPRGNGFTLHQGKDIVFLEKSEINRLHGIAFPEKRRTGECYNTSAECKHPKVSTQDNGTSYCTTCNEIIYSPE
jgi:hypothetical protein